MLTKSRRFPVLDAVLFWACLSFAFAPKVFAEYPNEPLPVLTHRIHAIFERSCAECHDAGTSRPRGSFGHVLNFPKLAQDPLFVIPGDPEDSDLYLVLIDPDPAILMPPPDSGVPALSEKEIALVHQWIMALQSLEGKDAAAIEIALSPVPPPDAIGREDEEVTAVVASTLPPPRTLFARTHPMVVHFPIALLMVAAFVEWLSILLRRGDRWVSTVRWMLGLSALSSPLAVASGWLLVSVQGYRPETVMLHRWLGVATMVFALAGWLAYEVAQRKKTSLRWLWTSRFIILAGAVLVALAGHTGGELVHGKGFPFR